jgi:N-6 DNA Methylase
MSKDLSVLAHKQWLGYVQPTGLVVSIPAMLDANVRINQNFAPEHRQFLDALPTDAKGDVVPVITDFPHFVQLVLGWHPTDLNGSPEAPEIPASLETTLPEYETLRVTYALREFKPGPDDSEWILLVKVLPAKTDFDAVEEVESRQWQASPQAKFERLLRQAHVPTGLLVNEEQIRLVYAPEKELSGHITFKLAEMVKVAGRPIFSAFHMLLNAERLYSVAKSERLPAILENSRKYQNVVSTQLANQVLEALYELLRGFQAANDQSQGELLRSDLDKDPDHVYRGLLTILLRLIFILYAEDRDLLSSDSVYTNYYSITGLYERLRIDFGRYPDTIDQRYGAWAQILTLCRLIYTGGRHGGMSIPSREGYLFDPDRYLFLEGRQSQKDKPNIPRVPDGVIFRVLSKLMILDGERISYRTLAVEQIGSVYEAIMGFELHVASGLSIAIKPAKKHGAPTTINLEALLAVPPAKRPQWFAEHTDQKLTGTAVEALKAAQTIADLQAALARKIATEVTPDLVAKQAMIFQPSNERRRSGSHYTPSSLTGPIVEAALDPVLKQLGENPTPTQILNLKVCDPAMGSGAFLVEACRQLGDALVKAWHAYNEVPEVLPPDEDEALYAQRMVAQRCLYGVDKNPVATDLAKLSLWLATLAKDHPFTFLDHSLRPGDSLVGLTRKQIAAFHWDVSGELTLVEEKVRKAIEGVSRQRQEILAARDDVPYSLLKQKLEKTEDDLSLPRMIGDAVIAAFFSGEKAKTRQHKRITLQDQLTHDLTTNKGFITLDGAIENTIKELRNGRNGIAPFHWALEFPEVFPLNEIGIPTGGFDVIVGNPPFAGKNTLIEGNPDAYLDWLKTIHPQSHGNADLVAHFFRRAITLLRQNGCFGLIATNTIGQGDTRSTGLRWICENEGTIYRATKRLKWPGEAAVVVSVIHACKGKTSKPYLLNGRTVDKITAYLFHAGGNENPAKLEENEDKSFIGSYILGMGFTFDDTDTKGIASPLSEMRRLIEKDPKNAERIFPYLGGEEVNSSPTHAHHRYVINFEDFPLERSTTGHSWFRLSEETQKQRLRDGIVAPDYPGPVAADWPDLLQIVKERVKPERERQGRDIVSKRWWQYERSRPVLFRKLASLQFTWGISRVSPWLCFGGIDARSVSAESVVLIVDEKPSTFAVIQSRIHEIWVRFFSSSLEDRLRYSPSDCFETFPFPEAYESLEQLERIGRAYYEFRANLMSEENQGLTKIYNRFHDPNENSLRVRRLRELHAELDRAVLDAYGWCQIPCAYEFIPEFDEEDEADNETTTTKRKKYRYRWSDEISDEVLARLLDLNRERAPEEDQSLRVIELLSSAKEEATKPRKKKTKKSIPESQSTMFATTGEEA